MKKGFDIEAILGCLMILFAGTTAYLGVQSAFEYNPLFGIACLIGTAAFFIFYRREN